MLLSVPKKILAQYFRISIGLRIGFRLMTECSFSELDRIESVTMFLVNTFRAMP